MNTRKLVVISLLVTLGTALHTLELLVPNPFPLPGMKLGLANIVTLLAIYIYGTKEALSITVLRVLFGALLGGTLFSVGFMLSMTGAVSSVLMMSLAHRFIPTLSIIGLSMLGAITHNIGQLFAAAVLIQTGYIFFYLPFHPC